MDHWGFILDTLFLDICIGSCGISHLLWTQSQNQGALLVHWCSCDCDFFTPVLGLKNFLEFWLGEPGSHIDLHFACSPILFFLFIWKLLGSDHLSVGMRWVLHTNSSEYLGLLHTHQDVSVALGVLSLGFRGREVIQQLWCLLNSLPLLLSAPLNFLNNQVENGCAFSVFWYEWELSYKKIIKWPILVV